MYDATFHSLLNHLHCDGAIRRLVAVASPRGLQGLADHLAGHHGVVHNQGVKNLIQRRIVIEPFQHFGREA